MPAKLALHFYRAHRRVQLNLLMEPVVIRLAEIVHEIERPRTAIAPRRIKARFNFQSFICDDRKQGTIGLQRFQFCFILDAGQIEPVDFGILDQQRFMRRHEQAMPAQPAEMFAGMVYGVDGECTARHAEAYERCKDKDSELRSGNSFHEVVSVLGNKVVRPLSPRE